MIEIHPIAVFVRAVNTAFTLYMLLILVRWAAPWLQLDLHSRRLQWIGRLTDPLINLMRRLLPPMGPLDFGPLAALIAVWIAREIILRIVLGTGSRV